MDRDIIRWFANGETGMSSKAMACAASGVDPTMKSHPCDPADLNRCIKLVDQVPDVKSQFPTIAKMSPQWAAVIQHWDRLRTLFHSEAGEDWRQAKSAPITYALMKSLGL